MAKDVITRFKLETTGFDSKIKEAAKELSAYSKTATQAKEGFNQFTKANVDAAKALGTMATSTTNAKDRAKELVGAFNDAAKAYNALSDEQKRSDWAKALSGSLTQLQQRIKETKAEMQGLSNNMGDMGGGGMFSGLGSKMSGALAVFGGNLMTKAAGAVAQLGSEMADMVKQGIELAKAGEGVRIAFERLGNGHILDGLREATNGTVTDIELMKAAVKFNDFKLPLDELGTMLAFAQQKAKDTGQSVDYMVDSIVTGLGRKSLMILDNLGLSASEIRERMKETGDMTKAVGAIIREQMEKTGDYVETAEDRAAQANVSLQNKMEELGRKFGPVEEASNQLWTSMKIGILDIIGGPLATLLNGLTEAGRIMNAYNKMGGNTKVGRMTANLANASEGNRQSIYQQQKGQFWRYINPREQMIKDIRAWQSGKRVEALQGRIGAIRDQYGMLDAAKIQAEVDAAKKMLSDYEQAAKSILKPVDAGINTDKAEQNVASLRKQLNELEAQRKKAVKAGDQELVETLTKQISQTKTNLGYLDPSSVKTGKSKQQQAEDKVAAALLDYNQTIEKASLELESGVATEADVKKKQLSAQERLYDAYGDAYALYKDHKYKDAQDKAAEEIVKLGGEVKAATEAQEAARKAARELESAQKKLADAQQKLAEAQSTGSATAIYQAQKNVDKQQAVVNRLQNPTLPATPQLTGFEAMKQSVQAEIKFDQMKVDETTLNTLLKTALQTGLDSVTVDYSYLQKRIADGIDIPENTWTELQNEINAKLKELGIDPMKIDFKTGRSREKSDKEENKSVAEGLSRLAGGLGGIESGFKNLGIDLGDGFEKVVGGLQGVSSILMGIQAIVSAIEIISSADALIPFANGGIVPHAANGYFVPGNSFSGDTTPILANAGEVVLNESQQGVLASRLSDVGGMRNIQVTGRLEGENIALSVDRWGRRTGKGELAFWKNQ